MFNTKTRVAGTEGTHNYVVIRQTKLGLLAVRCLEDNSFRVRVEPSSPEASAALATELQRNIFCDPSWKQPYDSGPHGQNRFSTVAFGNDELHSAVEQAIKALGDGEESDWEAALAAVAEVGTTDRGELINRLRQSGTPGANGAARWTTTTLVEKAFCHAAA